MFAVLLLYERECLCRFSNPKPLLYWCDNYDAVRATRDRETNWQMYKTLVAHRVRAQYLHGGFYTELQFIPNTAFRIARININLGDAVSKKARKREKSFRSHIHVLTLFRAWEKKSREIICHRNSEKMVLVSATIISVSYTHLTLPTIYSV